MKRREVMRHLEQNGCEFLREGANHTIYVNRAKGKASSVPRHKEINDFLVIKICRDLEILARRRHNTTMQPTNGVRWFRRMRRDVRAVCG